MNLVHVPSACESVQRDYFPRENDSLDAQPFSLHCGNNCQTKTVKVASETKKSKSRSCRGGVVCTGSWLMSHNSAQKKLSLSES